MGGEKKMKNEEGEIRKSVSEAEERKKKNRNKKE